MVIDFHTHIYPEKIAAKTIQALLSSADGVQAFTNGTVDGLRESMKKAGVDKSVILPVATRKGQFETINSFAENINKTCDDLISFGGIHPDDDDPQGKLLSLKERGFKGVKIHPDYTGTMIDDKRYINIITECARLGLLVVTHAGVDPAFEVIHCPPEKARTVLDNALKGSGTSKPFMVFAHLGGLFVHSDVEKYLLGSCCYIDISCSFSELGSYCDTTETEVVSVIKKHGADRILFATDSPWNDQKAYLEHFKAIPELSDKEKDMILFKNAEGLLL